jgi:hypothetical protein
MSDVLNVTVHGTSFKELQEEVDKYVTHFFRDATPSWTVVDPSMNVRLEASSQDGEPILYAADVEIRIKSETAFRQEYPARMRVTLLDDYGGTIFTMTSSPGEVAESEILPGRTVARLVVGP